MLLVLPICEKELPAAARLVTWMKMLGGMEKVNCLIVYTWKAQWDIAPIVEYARTFFGSVSTYLPPLEDESGWPISSNTFFQQTAEYLESIGNSQPWFWWECDVVPLLPGYWEALNEEYNAAGKPYMGVINQSMFKTIKEGVIVDGEPRPKGYHFVKGRHMVGAGIYPADFWKRCSIIRTLPEIAFDVAMGPEIEPETHDTTLIAHRWQTFKYRRTPEGVLTMDDVDPDENLYGGRPVPREAMIVHGCKDTSLVDLLITENKEKLLALAKQEKGSKLQRP
jgi:hypothetical protein